MKYIIVVFLLLSSVGCKKVKIKENDDSLRVVKPLENSVSLKDFNSCIDTAIIVPLETNDECFIIDLSKILVTRNKDFVVLNSTNILLFDSEGKFKFRIGKTGKGPGEYIRVIDICISDKEDKLMVLDCYNNVLLYSLENGQFIRKIKPKWEGKVSTFDGICSSNDLGFFLFSSNPPLANNFESDFYCLGKFDSIGNFLGQNFIRQDFYFSPDRFTRSYDNSTLMRPFAGSNILYRINNGNVSPALKIDFGKMSIPPRYIFSFDGDNPWLNIASYVKSPYFKLPMGFFETSTHLYFWCGGPSPDLNTYEFLFKKNQSKGINWKSKEDFPFNFIAADSTFFYACYNDMDEENKAKDQVNSPLKTYLKKMYPNIKKDNWESNPIIVKVAFSK